MKKMVVTTMVALALFCLCKEAISGKNPIFEPFELLEVEFLPKAVAIDDVDGDGLNEIVMTTSNHYGTSDGYNVLIFHQNEYNTLFLQSQKETRGGYEHAPKSVAIEKFHGKSKRKDIAVGLSGLGVEVFSYNKAGILIGEFYPTVNSDKIRAVDLNDDGLMDIVGIGWGTTNRTTSVLYQKPSGGFGEPVEYEVIYHDYNDLQVGDVNDDGLADIIVMDGSPSFPKVSILYQIFGGGFTEPKNLNIISPSFSLGGIAVGDFNGDSRNDVAVSYGGYKPDSHIGVFYQDKYGEMKAIASFKSYGCPEPIVSSDVSMNGKQDIIVAHGVMMKLGLYSQNNKGELKKEQLFDLPFDDHFNSHGLAAGDLNNDGKPDVAVAGNSGLVILYHR